MPSQSIATVQYINAAEKEIRLAFIAAMNSIRSNDIDALIEQLIIDGREESIADLADSIPAAIFAALTLIVVNTGERNAELITEHLDLTVPFVVTALIADSFVTEKDKLERYFILTQRDAIIEAKKYIISKPHTMAQQVNAYKTALGLNSQQTQAVMNYRSHLERRSSQALKRQLRDKRFDSSVRRSINGTRVLTPAQIDRMVLRYTERSLIARAKMIAITETTRAIHEGLDESFNQAISDGFLIPSGITHEWVIRHDGKARHSHNGMDKQKRTHGNPFISDNGVELRYPGDSRAPANETANCRCRVKTSLA